MSSLVPSHLHASRVDDDVVCSSSSTSNAKDEQLRKYRQLQELERTGQLSKAEVRSMVELELAIERDEKSVILQLGLPDDECTSNCSSQKVIEDDSDDDDDHPVSQMQRGCKSFCSSYGKLIAQVTGVLCLIGYFVYLGFALAYDARAAMVLTITTGLVVLVLLYRVIRDMYGETIDEKCCVPAGVLWDRHFHIIKWFLYPALVIGLIMYLVFDVLEMALQLQSLSGIIIFIAYTYLTCRHPRKIYWRPVIWGYSLQFIFAILVLRWEPGYNFVKWMSEVITKFVNFAYDGAAVTFGDPWMIFHAFSFMGSALIIYIGMLMAILYYYNITQVCAIKMGWLFQITLGTTAVETLAVASNIFLNGLDTMLMLRPYLPRLTKSEFHCFVVGGHSTVAGFAFALFVLFGAPPEHVLSAAVMSAPATIAICKLNVPETEESCTHNVEDIKMVQPTDINVFEAGANGAYIAGKTAATVIVNYIAFIALLSFIDSGLGYMGGLVGWEELSLSWLCSVIFWPLALIMGVEVSYCWAVAKIIGMKILCSEILAFQVLGQDVRAGLLNERSTAIATYAICGFSSLSTLFIAVGVWNAVCPQRCNDMTRQMFRIIVNANMACFMTACIAGLMYVPPDEAEEVSLITWVINSLIDAIPGYRDLMALIPT